MKRGCRNTLQFALFVLAIAILLAGMAYTWSHVPRSRFEKDNRPFYDRVEDQRR